MTVQPATGGIGRGPSPSGLADVIDTILDRGLVIDAYVRVSLIGIEILTVDARVVVASVDTYLRFADAVNRLDLAAAGPPGLPEVVQGVKQGAIGDKSKEIAQGVLEAAGEKLRDYVGERAEEREETRRRRREER
ncbi:gas vesicle protein GvpJ [Nonomuraea sp. SYSU D8015]|uniref:gas vesicle protein GvpJ n=1 Tax=Nonomuraea sp. SYSU D8015 TaxID=2593644 RepID=UPI001660C006|nr:gas vesicle protein GvpJ [Nonomuraea sp. SYSU D8015]